MAAPKGNQFWKMRSKHGRDRIFESPEIMLEAVYEFLEKKSEATISKPELIRSGNKAGEQADLTFKDYPTLQELAHFLGFKTLQGLYNYKEHKGFNDVITHAQEIIYSWKLKGASVGAYQHNIVAQELGLSNVLEHKGKLGIIDWSE